METPKLFTREEVLRLLTPIVADLLERLDNAEPDMGMGPSRASLERRAGIIIAVALDGRG